MWKAFFDAKPKTRQSHFSRLDSPAHFLGPSFLLSLFFVSSTMSNVDNERADFEAKARARTMMYWGPVAVTPIPYICVSLYRNAKTPQAKSMLLGIGMIGIPIATYAARVYLMSNASETADAAKKRPPHALTLEEQSRLGRL